MIQRWCAVVAFLFVTGECVTADARGKATTMRGQLALTFSLDDPGVAYVSSSKQDLHLELTISGDGSAVLRVRGHVESQGTFISPSGSTQSKPTRSEAEVDDRWEGRATYAHAIMTLKLSLVTGDHERDRDPLTLELGCKRTREALANSSSHKRVALQRCTPVTTDTGQPWNDRHPRYARVPLVFAVRGDVLSLVTADHDHATVQAPLAAPRAVTPP